MTNITKIREIFTSIQGEGPYIGYKQLFIRFCGCNIKCAFCDTNDYDNEEYTEFTSEELLKNIEEFNLKSIHSISLTGGEPLIWSDFLLEFLPLTSNKIYLETNATLKDELEKIINYVHIISADIKLPSSSGIENSFAVHDEFFKVAKKYNKEFFAKIVFDENILDDEISHCLKLADKYDIPLILQPKTTEDKILFDGEKILDISNKFLKTRQDIRVIPQVQKFLQIR